MSQSKSQNGVTKVAEYVSDSSVRKVGSFAFGNSKVVDETRRWAARRDAVVMVVRTDDGYDLYAVTEESAQKTGGCFIATAAYGSPVASEVIVLSRFRDEFLLKRRLGALLVSFYYLVSPPLATLITKATFLRTVTRVLLLAPILALLNGCTNRGGK
jgi:hypothetical protein